MVLLISTYDLGRQPFGLASPAAWLRRAGQEVASCDLSREPLSEEHVGRAALAAVYLPMHTATRLALPVIDRLRACRPDLPICAYGLYAPLNAEILRDHGVTTIIGPEAEEELVNLALTSPHLHISTSQHLQIPPSVPRLAFVPPDRAGLPSLERYAKLRMPDGTERVTGATEATRGCKHRCRHCPIVPIYDGQFRVVPLNVVLADIDQQIAHGAQHITFSDPDFFNGPTHARRIVEAVHASHPTLTYDVTIKVEHLLRHRELLPTLVETGCLFVTSAVESVDDDVLARLEKQHTRADFLTAAGLLRAIGLTMAPTFVAFTPWTTRESFNELLDVVEDLELIEHVPPVQWTLRLLITEGSRLLELEEVRRLVDPFSARTLTYPWRHPEPDVDALQARLSSLVGTRAHGSRSELFERIRKISGVSGSKPLIARAAIPYLDEPWYC